MGCSCSIFSSIKSIDSTVTIEHGWKPRLRSPLLPSSVFPLQTSDIPLQTSNIPLQTSDIPLQTSDIPLQTSDIRLQTSVLRPQASAFTGSTMVIVHPGPSLFSAVTRPPMATTNFLTNARPMPVPPVVRFRSLSTR